MQRFKRSSAVAVLVLLLGATGAQAAEKTALYEEGEKAESLVVRLLTESSEGAGVVFHVHDGYVQAFTAKHVVYAGKVLDGLKANLRPWPGKSFPTAVDRLHPDRAIDLAVVSVDLRSLGSSDDEIRKALSLDLLGSSSELDPGSEVYTVGHATAGSWLTPKQPLRYAEEADDKHFLFESDCPRGHSGGGVFDGDWRLVGMMIQQEAPYCRAMRVEEVLRFLQGWNLSISLYSGAQRQRSLAQVPQIKVAIVGFENKTNQPLTDLGLTARDVISTYLSTIPGVVLLTRDRLDVVNWERAQRGVEKSISGVEKVGRLPEADILVTGSVLVYDVERRKFEAYGSDAARDIYRMSISLQLIDTNSSRVRFSESYTVKRAWTYTKAASAPSGRVDRAAELLDALLEQAEGDLKSALTQLASGLETAGQFLRIPLTTYPAGADIILNGTYVGKSPMELRVTPGTHELVLELPGHRSWRKRIQARPGAGIEVTMVRP